MSHSAGYPELFPSDAYAAEHVVPASEKDYRSRTALLPVFFLTPVALSGVSMMGGGIPLLTDFSFVLLTVLCGIFLAAEFYNFPHRFGIGGLILFGGTLNWYCYDYLKHWYGADFTNPALPYGPSTCARAAFFVCVFVMMMTVGLNISKGQWFSRLFARVPEPAQPNFFYWLAIALTLFGLSPYFWFVDQKPWEALYNELTGGPVYWMGGRTGNLNYNWSGYVANFIEIGKMGAVIAAYYACMLRGSIIRKFICLAIWLFFLAVAYNTGRRGQIMFIAAPVAAMMFIRLQSNAVERQRPISLMAYLLAGGMFIGAVFMMQIQGVYRGRGDLRDVDVSNVSLTDLQGNAMYSESLAAYENIPFRRPYFYAFIPGGGVILPVPTVLFWGIIHPIPRALWHDKPVDPVWAWYNNLVTGENNLQGTTISTSITGWFYVRFGFFGVLEGGLLWGWMMRRAETALQLAEGRSMQILFSLAFMVWLFRCFRDVGYLELVPLVLAAGAIWFFVRIFGIQTVPRPQTL